MLETLAAGFFHSPFHIMKQIIEDSLVDSINQTAKVVHDLAKGKGWHPDGMSPYEKVQTFVANEHGEVSELWEALRSDKLDCLCDKANAMAGIGNMPLTCMEEELADIVIRALDTAYSLGVNIGRSISIKTQYNSTRTHRHVGKLA